MSDSKLVAVSNAKGGVGKSLHALMLALRAVHQDKKVLLVGAERDGAFDTKRAINQIENLDILSDVSRDHDFARKIAVYRQQYDLIVVDLPGNNLTIEHADLDGFAEKLIKDILIRSDLVVIPIEPSEEGVRKTVSFIKNLHGLAKATGKQIPQLLLPTDTTKGNNMTEQMLIAIEKIPVPKAVRSIRSSQDLKKAFAKRQGIWKFKKGAMVNNDLTPVHSQIFEMLGMK